MFGFMSGGPETLRPVKKHIEHLLGSVLHMLNVHGVGIS